MAFPPHGSMTLPIGAHLPGKMIINLLIQCVINVRKLMVQQSKQIFVSFFIILAPACSGWPPPLPARLCVGEIN